MSDDEEDAEGGRESAVVNQFQLVYEPSPVVPPDGGYGWVVVVAAFFVNLIADGVTFSFGILLSELFESMDDTREDISWIGSFLAGVPLLLGPVTSLLIDRFGCRAVTLSGSLISGIGFALMYVLPQSTLLFVFSGGLLAGIGLGLVFMPAVVAVSFYFMEKRALATGVAMSGSGVGTVVFAYITQACIDAYTWRGSFLIIGGILLNVCVCGALYRPLEPSDFKKMKRMQRLFVQFQAETAQRQADASAPLTAARTSPPSSGSSRSPSLAPPAPTDAESAHLSAQHSVGGGAVGTAKSLLAIPTYLADEFSQSPRSPAPLPRSQQRPEPPAADEKQLIATLKLGYLQRMASALPDNALATVHCNVNGSGAASAAAAAVAMAKANTSHELVDYARRISRRDQQQQQEELEQRRLEQQQQQQEQQQEASQAKRLQTQQLSAATAPHAARRRHLFPVDRRYFMQHTRPSVTTVLELYDSCPEFGRIPAALHNRRSVGAGAVASAPRSRQLPPLTAAAHRLVKSKPFRDMRFLFTSWDYVAFLASNFLLYFWYDITYTFLPDHAKDINLRDSDVSMIIGLIGVSNTIGQIAIGYVGDFPRVDSALLYAACMSLTGLANFLVPWCLSRASLLVYGIFYGFLVSANYALCSIVIIDLFGLERLTTGYGFMMLFQGVGNLVGPPVMGHMRDTDTNYRRAFIYSGVFVFASNLLILPMYRTLYAWAAARGRACRRSCCADGAAAATPAEAAQRQPLTTA